MNSSKVVNEPKARYSHHKKSQSGAFVLPAITSGTTTPIKTHPKTMHIRISSLNLTSSHYKLRSSEEDRIYQAKAKSFTERLMKLDSFKLDDYSNDRFDASHNQTTQNRNSSEAEEYHQNGKRSHSTEFKKQCSDMRQGKNEFISVLFDRFDKVVSLPMRSALVGHIERQGKNLPCAIYIYSKSDTRITLFINFNKSARPERFALTSSERKLVIGQSFASSLT